MSRGEDERRWRTLSGLREEIEHEGLVVPMVRSRIDGRPLETSDRALQFAEGLSFADSWAGISNARRRRAA